MTDEYMLENFEIERLPAINILYEKVPQLSTRFGDDTTQATVSRSASQNQPSEKLLKVCHICNAVFRKTFSLKRHLKLHTQDKPHKCTVCSFAFIQKSDLIRHMAVHSNVFAHTCDVDGCGKTFRTKRNLHSHQSNTHYRRGFYRCPVCRKRFKFISTMKIHYLKEHTECDLFECDLCGKDFKTKSLLRSHFQRHLKSGPKFKPKYQKVFDHFKYVPTTDENDSEEEIKVTVIEETGEFEFEELPADDQFEIEMVTEVVEDFEIKTEILEDEEANLMAFKNWKRSYSSGELEEKETQTKKPEMKTIRKAMKVAKVKEEIEADRVFLHRFLPRMKMMKEEEKTKFKEIVLKIQEKVMKIDK